MNNVIDSPQVRDEAFARYQRGLRECLHKYMHGLGVERIYFDAKLMDFEGAFDDVRTNALIKAIKDNKNIYLYGNHRTGKTRLAVAIMKEWMLNFRLETEYDREYQRYYVPRFQEFFRFVYVPDLVLAAKDAMNFRSDEKQFDIVEEYSSYKYLVMDDVGAEKKSDMSINLVNSIANHRLNRKLVTIWTSNLSIDELGSMYDLRFSERVLENVLELPVVG